MRNIFLFITCFTVALSSFSAMANKCITNEAALSDLKEQKLKLKSKSDELEKRESDLLAKERAIAEQIESLEKLKKEILAAESENLEKNEAKVNKLVETLDKMSPKKSAAVLASLSDSLAVAAMMKLPSARLAKVMNVMEPERSAFLSEYLATGRKKNKSESKGKKKSAKKGAANEGNFNIASHT